MTMELTTIEAGSDGSLGRIQLNRPEKRNALSPTTLRELAAAARWFDSMPEVKVVVLSGRGRSFSAGADLSTFVASDPDLSERDAGTVQDAVEHEHVCVQGLQSRHDQEREGHGGDHLGVGAEEARDGVADQGEHHAGEHDQPGRRRPGHRQRVAPVALQCIQDHPARAADGARRRRDRLFV